MDPTRQTNPTGPQEEIPPAVPVSSSIPSRASRMLHSILHTIGIGHQPGPTKLELAKDPAAAMAQGNEKKCAVIITHPNFDPNVEITVVRPGAEGAADAGAEDDSEFGGEVQEPIQKLIPINIIKQDSLPYR